MQQPDQRKKSSQESNFFTEYADANRYKIQEVIGKGSYGTVCSALDMHTGEKVAIKKVSDIFEHVSDATRILREIKLLRLLRHPDIVEIKHIMLPSSKRDFKDIYVVFELMESDLHQVIKANNDLTKAHHKFFLYQMLRALKYIHTANVYHRDLKPKNILANANCKLKVCDFGLARVALNDTPTTIFWTDYVATRWYRAPELCGSFYSKYSPAIDIWSIGCIFAEVLLGKPLFPGNNIGHQLNLITDLLGTPSMDTLSRVCNEKARKYLSSMTKKQPVSFCQKFPNADSLALKLLERLLAFDPKDRPTAEEALADDYFKGLAKVEREPSCQAITKLEFEFESHKMTKEDVRELIFHEILEYHPQLLKDYMNGLEWTTYLLPIGHSKKQFTRLEDNCGQIARAIPLEGKHSSLPRSTTVHSTSVGVKDQLATTSRRERGVEAQGAPSKRGTPLLSRKLHAPQTQDRPEKVGGSIIPFEKGAQENANAVRGLMRGSVLPPQYSRPISGCFAEAGNSGNQHRKDSTDRARVRRAAKPPCVPNNNIAKVTRHASLDVNSSLFLEVASRSDVGRIGNYLTDKPSYNVVAAGVGVNFEKIDTIQYGMSRMC